MHQKCTSPVSVVAHRFKNEVKKKNCTSHMLYENYIWIQNIDKYGSCWRICK